MSLSIIIPVYNEIDQLKYTIKKLLSLKKKIKNFDIIFIDDFSDDDSFKYIKKISNKNSLIKIFKNKKKGLGPAISRGILKSKSDFICTFMSDLSDDINDLVKYFKIIKKKNQDAVLGTRFSKKSKIINYPIFNLLLNKSYGIYCVPLIITADKDNFRI